MRSSSECRKRRGPVIEPLDIMILRSQKEEENPETDNSMVVIKGKWGGGVVNSKVGQIYGDRR